MPEVDRGFAVAALGFASFAIWSFVDPTLMRIVIGVVFLGLASLTGYIAKNGLPTAWTYQTPPGGMNRDKTLVSEESGAPL